MPKITLWDSWSQPQWGCSTKRHFQSCPLTFPPILTTANSNFSYFLQTFSLFASIPKLSIWILKEMEKPPTTFSVSTLSFFLLSSCYTAMLPFLLGSGFWSMWQIRDLYLFPLLCPKSVIVDSLLVLWKHYLNIVEYLLYLKQSLKHSLDRTVSLSSTCSISLAFHRQTLWRNCSDPLPPFLTTSLSPPPTPHLLFSLQFSGFYMKNFLETTLTNIIDRNRWNKQIGIFKLPFTDCALL